LTPLRSDQKPRRGEARKVPALFAATAHPFKYGGAPKETRKAGREGMTMLNTKLDRKEMKIIT